jgi:hypothetical protein
MRIRTVPDNGWTQLSYTLHSPAGVAPFSHLEIDGPVLKSNPEELHRNLLHQIGELGAGRGIGGELLLHDEIDRRIIGLGRDLWRQLFNEEMRQAYRSFRSSVRTLLIISDEPWIPWEMVKPFDDEGEILDDPFFAEQFELTRWLSGKRALPGDLEVRSLACVTGAGHLPLASREKDLIRRLAQENEGVRDVTPDDPGVHTLTSLLEEGGLGLLHFALHGSFEPALPNEAGLLLTDGSVFRPSDLHGPVQTRISQDRPLIVLNACSSGRQSWTWTGLGGWADRWVRVCGCGAFIGPLWPVRDSAAFAFAQGLYRALARGDSLGRAAQEARFAVRDMATGEPSWLAYAVYGHPHAQTFFGTDEQLPGMPASIPEKASSDRPARKPEPSAWIPRGHPQKPRWIWMSVVLGFAVIVHFAAPPILERLFPITPGSPMHLPKGRVSGPEITNPETAKVVDQASEVHRNPKPNPRSPGRAPDKRPGTPVDPESRESALRNSREAPESPSGQENLSLDLVRLTVHPGFFARSPKYYLYFINVTNISKDTIEITNVWFQCPDSSCQIMVKPWSRPLPKRLMVHQAWSTWIAVSELPPNPAEPEPNKYREDG